MAASDFQNFAFHFVGENAVGDQRGSVEMILLLEVSVEGLSGLLELMFSKKQSNLLFVGSVKHRGCCPVQNYFLLLLGELKKIGSGGQLLEEYDEW
jgi:hypothetical protein